MDGYDVPLIEEEEKTLPEFEGADKTVDVLEKLYDEWGSLNRTDGLILQNEERPNVTGQDIERRAKKD
jgi:hypothetical protein